MLYKKLYMYTFCFKLDYPFSIKTILVFIHNKIDDTNIMIFELLMKLRKDRIGYSNIILLYSSYYFMNAHILLLLQYLILEHESSDVESHATCISNIIGRACLGCVYFI